MSITPSKSILVATGIVALIAPSAGCALVDGFTGSDFEDDGSYGGSQPPDVFPPEEDVMEEPDPLFATRRAFVTRVGRSADLGGLPGADAICQQKADEANLGGFWLAWLADDVASPETRFVQGMGPYIRLDGAVIAYDWFDLTDGVLEVPINKAPDGSTVPEGNPVWSNVASSGARQGGSNCSNWTEGPGSVLSGRVGDAGRSDTRWSADNSIGYPCDFVLRHYCFEQ